MTIVRSFLMLFVVAGSALMAADAPQVDPKILDVLHKVEAQINSSDYLSYHVVRTQQKLGSDEKPMRDEVTIWAKRVPDDALHGAYFHIKGSDDYGPYDYYFDSDAGREVRDRDKKVILYRVADFPIDVGHPALCMRTAVMFHFSRIVMEPELVRILLRDYESISMNEEPETNTWIVSIRYKKNHFGQKDETLQIDRQTHRIKRIFAETNWNGIVYQSELIYADYTNEKEVVAPYIRMSDDFQPDYTREVYERRGRGSGPDYTSLIGKPAPDFSYTSFSGEVIALEKLKSKLVVLDFWETWCGACMMAFPHVNTLQEKWGDRIVVIGVVSENKNEVQKVLDNVTVTYATIFADPQMVKDYCVNGRPTYFLINGEGKIVTAQAGNLAPIEAAIEKLLGEEPEAPQDASGSVE